MSRANSRLTEIKWGQIQEIARRKGIQGLPPHGDQVKCYKQKLPIGSRPICFMTLVQGGVRETVVVLARRATPTKHLQPLEFTEDDTPKLFIRAAKTEAMLRQLEEEAEEGVRHYAEPSLTNSQPAPFAAKTASAKRRPNRRSSRVRFRSDQTQVAR